MKYGDYLNGSGSESLRYATVPSTCSPMKALHPASGQVKDNAVGVRVIGEGRVHVDGDDNSLLDGLANLAGEFVGSAYAFL